ncbi:hypothetical protein HCN44_004887 [Aphidius gifuensis]|uniref:Uncharacterized protein n=1 Tax=Aphidius gifuensis TaxID=684658 RepID=A0A834XU46_APHGI|nr:hypothetical protein HCN44_004887 [Aphidius gifuensis]
MSDDDVIDRLSLSDSSVVNQSIEDDNENGTISNSTSDFNFNDPTINEYFNLINTSDWDRSYGVRKLKSGYSIGNSRIFVKENNLIIKDHEYPLTLVNLEEQMSKLETTITPWDAVSKMWSDTYSERRILLTDGMSISSYFQKFPCLSLAKGQELLVSDFLKLYPGYENTFQQNWTRIKPLFMSKLQEINIENPDDNKWQSILSAARTEYEDSLIFWLLPYSLLSKGEKRGRKSKKPEQSTKHSTLIEYRKSFIINVEVQYSSYFIVIR